MLFRESLPTVLAICSVEQNFLPFGLSSGVDIWINPCPPFLWVLFSDKQTGTNTYIRFTRGLFGFVLLLWGSKYCSDVGVWWHTGGAEEPELQRDPPPFHCGQQAAEYTVVIEGRGCEVAMGCSVIEPLMPCTENRCTAEEWGKLTGRVGEAAFQLHHHTPIWFDLVLQPPPPPPQTKKKNNNPRPPPPPPLQKKKQN